MGFPLVVENWRDSVEPPNGLAAWVPKQKLGDET